MQKQVPKKRRPQLTRSSQNKMKRYVPTMNTTLKTQAARTIRRTIDAISSGRTPGKAGRPLTKLHAMKTKVDMIDRGDYHLRIKFVYIVTLLKYKCLVL